MKLVIPLLAACLALLPLSARAAEANEAAVDPTGTWKCFYVFGPGHVMEGQFKLRLAEGKLSGVVVGPDKQELPLEKAEFKDRRIRFEVTRQIQGKKFTTRYEGTITGDRLKGKSSPGARTSAPSRDWEAVRVRDQTPPAAGAKQP